LSLIIHTKDLVKQYRNRTVVNHVSIDVKQGEIVGLLGPNGAGKTTTFYMVVGLIQPDEGEVYLNDQHITSMPMYKRAQMGIGYLPQEASVFRKLSVEDNIAAVLEMTKLSKADQRNKLEILADGSVHYLIFSPRDPHRYDFNTDIRGTWRFDPYERRFMIFNNNGKIRFTFQVHSIAKDELVLSYTENTVMELPK